MLQIFIGYDYRQDVAAQVCAFSLKRHASQPVNITFLNHRGLRAAGIFTRPWLIEEDGQFKDLRDGKPFSTEFSHTRFLVQALAPEDAGHVLFVDCDFLFQGDVADLFALADQKKAIQCVQVNWQPPTPDGKKMDGMLQTQYKRKLWSSIMLWNTKHPSNKQCNPFFVNYAPGNVLHAFGWLKDTEVGALPETWNWMEGITDKVKNPKAIHYTHGGPWLGGDFLTRPFAKEWLDEFEEMKRNFSK